MNVVLLVVDSLRARSLTGPEVGLPQTPFLRRLAREALSFTRAYATECWTLPAHCSMFTGLLPSEHGAHFQTMAYTKSERTVAELFSSAGYHTEIVTRNSIFDGLIPGITRGFQKNTQVLAERSGLNPLSLMLAASKPRFRHQILTSGFFHPNQRESREFLIRFARATVPADRDALGYLLREMTRCRDRGTPFFFFCNLYDVHAPYPPTERSIFRPLRRPSTWHETCLMPFVLPQLGGHAYLREDFSMPEAGRRLLLGRYHSAIELMDDKLAEFHAAATEAGLLDDTLLIVTSDHGEGFGEHGLYLHDASVYDLHLHVPLFVCHPSHRPVAVDDVVSTRDLFGLLRAAIGGRDTRDTLLDAGFRAAHPIALAEHFYYPRARNPKPRHMHNLIAAIVGERKLAIREAEVDLYDLTRDPDECAPEPTTIEDFVALCRRDRIPEAAIAPAVAHLNAFHANQGRPAGLAA